MAAPLFQLTGLLRKLAFDVLVTQSPIGKVKINALAKPTDVVNAMRYTIKSANRALAKQAIHAFMAVLPATIFINTTINKSPPPRARNF